MILGMGLHTQSLQIPEVYVHSAVGVPSVDLAPARCTRRALIAYRALRQRDRKDEGISGLPKQNNPTTLPGHVDPRTHEGKLFNSWRFSGDGSCHEETPFSPGSTSTCHARSQGNPAHSTRSRRNKRLNGKQDTTKVLRASPNPAAHGVGTTSPRQGRLKPTTRKSMFHLSRVHFKSSRGFNKA